MTNFTRTLFVLALAVSALPVFAQKYKTADDTVKLNKEYVKLTNDMVELNARLQVAENNLPGYQAKAKDANMDAVDAAAASSDQASKATNGEISDAKTARRKARKAYSEAKDLRSARNNVSDQEDKITRYKLSLKKKQQRKEELDVMRAAIALKVEG